MFETKCDKIYSRCKIVAKYILAKKKSLMQSVPRYIFALKLWQNIFLLKKFEAKCAKILSAVSPGCSGGWRCKLTGGFPDNFGFPREAITIR